jgi:pimeloyl-ACP methyl ester carboxylesterase
VTTTPTKIAQANGIEIAYGTFGAPTGTPVLLIMGLGAQMIAWPDAFCEELAARGDYVIRYDNRDVGESTHLSDLPAPHPVDSLLRRGKPPYRLEDMADDAAGLLGALGVGSAHVVGASMGGFIAQELVIRHPARVRSLTLIMTSTGSRRVGHPKLRVLARMGRRRAVTDRAAAVESSVETFRMIGSPGFPYDEAYMRDLAGRGYDRSYDFDGYRRQVAAIAAQADRSSSLAHVRAPTVVLHGLADPLVSENGGRAIARAIPGARFVGYSGMGHDLPRALWPSFADEISSVVAAGEARLGATR